MNDKNSLDELHRPVYLISVVSDMLSVHPQTLRGYEREGFISPSRSGKPGKSGGQRLYSRADVEKLSLILDLTRDLGVNRAGVDIILRLRRRLELLQNEVELMVGNLDNQEQENVKKKLNDILQKTEK